MASQISSPPSFIYWYKGSRVVNYSQRGGINVNTDRSTKTSKLVISKAEPGDSGNYTCAPSNSGKSSAQSLDFDTNFVCLPLDSASVVVHVITGEHPAAMQYGNSSAISLHYTRTLINLTSPFSLLKSIQSTNSYLILLCFLLTTTINPTFAVR